MEADSSLGCIYTRSFMHFIISEKLTVKASSILLYGKALLNLYHFNYFLIGYCSKIVIMAGKKSLT